MYICGDDSDGELDFTTFDDGPDAGNTSNYDDDDEQPLYPGASVTVGAFMLLLTVFSMKHNLVGDGILQLLNIIAFALPKDHKLCTSLHEYKKFFRSLKNPLIKHFYCSYCLGYLKDESVTTCPFSGCGKTRGKKEKLYFLEMPVDIQVQILFSQSGFYDKIQSRFTGNQTNDKHVFKDICDGSLYQLYSDNNGPLSHPENVSFTFNTDGAPVFKSSKVSVWPLFMVINELPYKMRMMKENMILAGLWFGSQKPSMGTFLSPFLESFRKLHQGIQCFSPERGTFTSRAYLLCGTADLPARCMLCNSVQFNGAFSCWKCLQRGETAKRGKGHSHVFPYIDEQPKGPKRTRDSVIDDSRKSLDNLEKRSTNFSVNGIKGPSWLTFFPKFNIIDGIAIDYMHGVLLGVQKLMLRLWFSSEFKNKCFSFHNKVGEVDRRLQNIHPTLDITRLPRSIENDLKYWKASEFRSFLLFFGPPVLYNVLDSTRFTHFLLLVNAMHILLKHGSSDNDIMKAESMLFDFYSKFERLYDKCYMTLNIHQLIHLPDSVRCLGPLYTHSCFSFEDKNGFMLKMIRGTQNIDNQIITGISFIQKLPELRQKCIVEGSDLDKLYKSIESPNLLKRGETIEMGVYILGALKLKNLSDIEYSKMCDFLSFAPLNEKFCTFKRLELFDNIIYGLEYARMTKRDNSTIMYTCNEKICFGRVRFFVRVPIGDDDSIVVAYTEMLDCGNFFDHCSILSVNKTDNTEFVPITNIKEGCMYVSPDDTRTSYVCRFPNKLESD